MAVKRRAGKAPPLHVAIVAGEHSGDALGAALMAALRKEHGGDIVFSGIGGEAMEAEGLKSLVPLADIALMGFGVILANLRKLLRHVRVAARAIAASGADVLVVIDSPEFTHAVARRVRKARPSMPIVNYVPPTVWAWRPWRARKMRRYVDLSLALLPFEPEVHERLGGPPCVYVGHPLSAKRAALRRKPARPAGKAPVLVVLPGSRTSEVRRLMAPFGETAARLKAANPGLEIVLPAVAGVRGQIDEALASWAVKPRVVTGEAAKFAAFRSGTAALAASGTVSLELALARLPMVVGYKLEAAATVIRYLVISHSVVMANLVLGRNAVPEFLQEKCTPQKLQAALQPLLEDGPERTAQLAAFDEIDTRMRTKASPSVLAAREVLRVAARGA